MRHSLPLLLVGALLLGSTPVHAATVEEVVDAQGCSTTAVWGLSVQIVDEMNCLVPGALAEVPDRPNLSMGSAVFPYLQTTGRDALVSALDDHAGTTLSVSSMLRTVAQQYLLYRWYQAGACGIPLAATPGSSNHEQGRALDTSSYTTWDPILGAYGWDWYGNSDVYHFTFNGAGWVDLQGTDVLAFQRLWNLNHPEDLIAEDGDYGPQTGARLAASPADGFATGAGACCGDVDAIGLCDGNLLRWCGGAGLEERDCAAEGLVCGADPGTGNPACLAEGPGPDAGTPGPDSSTPGPDSGTPGPDGGTPPDALVTPDGSTDATGPGMATNGCGCSTPASPDAGLLLLLLAAAILRVRRRRLQGRPTGHLGRHTESHPSIPQG